MTPRKPLPRAESEEHRLKEAGPMQDPTELYRGREDVRWRMRFVDGKLVYEVCAQCVCGRWWGWTDERRVAELQSLLEEGCPKCSAE